MLALQKAAAAREASDIRADLAKAKGRREHYTQTELTGEAASLIHAAEVAADVVAFRAEDLAADFPLCSAHRAVRVQRLVF